MSILSGALAAVDPVATYHAGKQDKVHGDIAEFPSFTHTGDPAQPLPWLVGHEIEKPM